MDLSARSTAVEPAEIAVGGGYPSVARRPLPTGPLVALFGFYPLWWVLGVVDIIWIPTAVVMAYQLSKRGGTRAPIGFGLYLLFLAWSLFSVIELPSFTSFQAFAYRYLIYASCAVFLLYIYNARDSISERFISGVMTTFWLFTVAGGYLGLLVPFGSFRTVMDRVVESPSVSRLIPPNVLSNELFQQMIVRKFAQYSTNIYTYSSPRPSAPFLYTNNWGSAYSMLIPFVIIYLLHVRRERKAILLAVMLLASIVPAFLTLNRGMFIGLGIAAVYGSIRMALLGNRKGVAAIALATLVGIVAFAILPTQSRLENRLSKGSTTTRATLYKDAIDGITQSPFFGYGGPRKSADPYAPNVGTQGQFWLVLYSHGIPGAAFFVGWFLATFVASIKRPDPGGLAWNTVMLVATVELFYYGIVPSGLPIIMVAAGLAMRGTDRKRLRSPAIFG